MSDFFGSGRVVDLIIGLMALESVAIFAYLRLSGRRVATAGLIGNLLAGLFLLLALRSALVSSSWAWTGLCLFAALLAHLVDLAQRLGTAPVNRADAGAVSNASG